MRLYKVKVEKNNELCIVFPKDNLNIVVGFIYLFVLSSAFHTAEQLCSNHQTQLCDQQHRIADNRTKTKCFIYSSSVDRKQSNCTGDMDELFLCKRIFCDDEFINGGVLVTPEGKIRSILRSQEEINSWMYSNESNEVTYARPYQQIKIMK